MKKNKVEKLVDYVFSDEGQRTMTVKACNVVICIALLSAIGNPSTLIIASMALVLKLTAKK